MSNVFQYNTVNGLCFLFLRDCVRSKNGAHSEWNWQQQKKMGEIVFDESSCAVFMDLVKFNAFNFGFDFIYLYRFTSDVDRDRSVPVALRVPGKSRHLNTPMTACRTQRRSAPSVRNATLIVNCQFMAQYIRIARFFFSRWKCMRVTLLLLCLVVGWSVGYSDRFPCF